MHAGGGRFRIEPGNLGNLGNIFHLCSLASSRLITREKISEEG
jgi:hypothetical protein